MLANGIKKHTSQDGMEWCGLQSENQKTVCGLWTCQPNSSKYCESSSAAAKEGFIFRAANGSPLHQSNLLRRSLHPILESLKRNRAGFQGFRRFRVTHLRKSNTPEDLLRFWIEHGDKTVTDRLRETGRRPDLRQSSCGASWNWLQPRSCPLLSTKL